MRQRDLSGTRPVAAARERRHAGAVVRVPERPPPADASALEFAGHRGDQADLQRLPRGQRRQDAGEPLGEHGLAGARRTDHQQVVAAGRGDLQGPLGRLLTLDIGEVELGAAVLGEHGLGRREHLGALPVVDQRRHMVGRQHRRRAGPGRLGPVLGRTHDGAAQAGGGQGGGHDAGHRRDAPVERQLAQDQMLAHDVVRQRAQGLHQGDRDGQVVMAAFLDHPRGRQVDRNAPARQGQADGRQGGTHPLPALAHGLVGQADDGEGRLAGDQRDLHLDRQRLDAGEGDGDDSGRHGVQSSAAGAGAGLSGPARRTAVRCGTWACPTLQCEQAAADAHPTVNIQPTAAPRRRRSRAATRNPAKPNAA